MVADGRSEEPRPEAPLTEDAVRPLEHRHACPRQGCRVGDDAVTLGLHPQPVLDPADHDRDDRSHPVDRQSVRLAPAQAPLHRLGRGDRLGDAEAHGAVDVDPAVRRLLHDPDAD
jgi:hypothetical protein